ncbi:ammonium transporter, partial [uncultured Bilophila sp.]
MYTLNTGDTAFVMLCTALVCLMTPALALFYGGMVPRKNVLTIMMQNFISMGVIAVIWIFGGFSLAFGPDLGGIIGDITFHFGLDGVGVAPSTEYASTVPFILFFAYQLMFAVIAPALITGAFAGRLTFNGYLKFIILWMIFIYLPACHWIWGGGFL